MTGLLSQVMIQPRGPEDSGFASWRVQARFAVMHGTPPDGIDFIDAQAPATGGLFGGTPAMEGNVPPSPSLHVPKAFMKDAEVAAHHRSPNRWNLLYRLLYRLQQNRNLLHLETDIDVAELRRLVHQIHYDVHKVHAFVRFRRIVEEDSGLERYVAYHQPAHPVLPIAAPFFAERFAPMSWSILTPDCCAHWNPDIKQLTWSPGVPREMAPQSDEVEDLWRGYYASIFNPARLNPKLMRQHMPTRYWSTLPEVDLLPSLIPRAETRVQSMVATQRLQPTAAPFVPGAHTLPVLRDAIPGCKGCDLYQYATQAVFGRGKAKAHLMLVGEQPGDQEDQQGEPFVGPAGKLLRRALEETGLDPATVYMTNAVKHFKFTQRGKVRLHQSPRSLEINACRPWLEAEIEAIKPRVILCLGATAAKSLLGGTFKLMQQRGQIVASKYADRTIATLHPSAILRARDETSRQEMYRMLTEDLLIAHREANRAA